MKTTSERIASAKRAIRSNSWDGIERRIVPAVVTRASGDKGGGFVIVGHAAVFNTLSENLGLPGDEWYELIEPGAFAAVLRTNPDVRALFNHDANLVLGRTKNGTLTLAEDTEGLDYRAAVSAELAATDIGERMRVYLDEGHVDQSSFAFRVARNGDVWAEDEQGRLVRRIRQFSALYDVSPVTYPAYPAADVGLAGPPAPTTGAVAVVSPHPARDARARRLEERQSILNDEAATERKRRKRELQAAGWPGWNDGVGAGVRNTDARKVRLASALRQAPAEPTAHELREARAQLSDRHPDQ